LFNNFLPLIFASTKIHTMHKVKLYYLKGKLHLVGIELDGVKHLTGDIRGWNPSELLFVLSSKTIEDKILNTENTKEMVDYGYYILIEKEIEVDIQKDIYTYCYIDEKYNLVAN